MLSFPHAKINLGLHILERRPDGYHNLETCFVPVPSLCDAIEMIPQKGHELPDLKVVGMPWTEAKEKNLVWKAWRRFQEMEPACPDFHWIILKKIPTGGGLGGGSSDAAFALRMLADYCHWPGQDPRLHQLASELGSDCPFFLFDHPMLGSGRGEILEKINIDLKGYKIEFDFLQIHISTAQAFSGISPQKPKKPLREVLSQPIQTWKVDLINDFEKPIFRQFPELEKRKAELYNKGAVYAAMSGSGSTLFGLFPS